MTTPGATPPFRRTSSRPTRRLAAAVAAGLVSAVVSAPGPAAAVPPDVELSVSRQDVRAGDSVVVRWSTTGAVEVRAGGDWSGRLPGTGARTIRLRTAGTATFSLSAANQDGAVLAETVVTVHRPARRLTVRSTTDLVLRGRRVPLRVTGLAAAERYAVRIGTATVARGRADDDGRVDRAVAVPRAGREGPLRLVVTGSEDDRRGRAVLRVVRPRELGLGLGAPAVEAGRDQRVAVRGLAAGEQVTVRHRGGVVATGHADRGGRFVASFDVGPGWGTTQVTVVGAFASRHASRSFDVIPRTPDGDR